jgi:hypothetical protein
MIKLLDLSTEADLAEAEHTPALTFFVALVKLGLREAIPNTSVALGAVTGDRFMVPFAVSVKGGGRCYLASFTRMYMDGAADTFRASKDVMLRLASPGARAAGWIARALGMDDVITLNNNLYVTMHVPDWSAVDVAGMTHALVARYPRHAIWVRGLNDRLDSDALARLQASGYIVAPSRPVEILDPTAPGWKIASNIPKDLTRMRRLPFTRSVGGPFSDEDFAAMERYSQLATVDQHSQFLPHYKASFFRACAAWPECRFDVLRDASGALAGYATMIIGENRISCGNMGYDVAREDAWQIYRALNALQMEHVIKLKRPYNLDFGATAFKRLRGTVPAMEMNAVYVRHLPLVKRTLWTATLAAVKRIAGSVIGRL